MKKEAILIATLLLPAALFAAQETDSSAAGNGAVSSSDSLKEQIENVKGSVDGLNESYLETKATVGALSKIKVSGYIQAQWNRGDTEGVVDASNKLVKDRFLIKRGRLKTVYDAGLSQYVLELDVTQDGVGIKDAYAMFKEPWLKSFSLTMGAQDRPFGYEVHYSSSQLESPERSKVIGTFFPKEKDIGAMLEFAQDDGPLSWLNAKVGVFNGQTNILNENDGYKDIIGRLGVNFAFPNAGFSISGGVSGYYGKVTNTDTTMYTKAVSKIDSSKWTTKSVLDTVTHAVTWTSVRRYDTTYAYSNKGASYEMDGTSYVRSIGVSGQQCDRQYYGADLQLTYATPVIGGTCLKGEVVAGKQPGTSSSSGYYAASNPSNSAVYNREALGYYAYFIQNIDPAFLQFVFKYDFYDPNTKVKASDFDTTATYKPNLGAADIAYQTFGIGLLWYVPWATNIRCMLFYEIPQNEKLTNPIASLAKYKKDLTDNLLTARIQVKF